MGRLTEDVTNAILRSIEKRPDAAATFIEDGIRTFTEGLLDHLYTEIEHGDEDHRKWLKDKIHNFKKILD